MRKETTRAGWIGGVAFGLFLMVSPFLEIHGQKKDETPNQKQEEQLREAQAALARSAVGSRFFDTISVTEPKWVLNKAGYIGRGLHNHFTYFGILLKKGNRFLGVSISEHDSPEDADEIFGGPTTRSDGSISVPFNNYGDKGDKLIGQNGDLSAIRFRKGNFFVAIWNRDQKTAERFAVYVLESWVASGLSK